MSQPRNGLAALVIVLLAVVGVGGACARRANDSHPVRRVQLAPSTQTRRADNVPPKTNTNLDVSATLDRTLAAGTAMLRLELPAPDGSAFAMHGPASLTEDRAEFTIDSADPTERGMRLRITPTGQWLQLPEGTEWMAVPASPEGLGALAAGSSGWRSFFDMILGVGIEPVMVGATTIGENAMTRWNLALDDQVVAEVLVDAEGRFRRIRLSGAAGAADDSRITIDLSDFGIPVEVADPV